MSSKAGEVQNRDYIYKAVIGREYDGLDRSVDVRISRLRKKLHDSTDTPFRIKTIWGQGYLFVPDACYCDHIYQGFVYLPIVAKPFF